MILSTKLFCKEVSKTELTKCAENTDEILDAIQKSKQTTLARFIRSLSIPLIDDAASLTIAKYFEDLVTGGDGEWFDEPVYIMLWCVRKENTRYWVKLKNFTDEMSISFSVYIKEHMQEIEDLAWHFTFVPS